MAVFFFSHWWQLVNTPRIQLSPLDELTVACPLILLAVVFVGFIIYIQR